jgi:peptide methionine sulfoxide reductase msrA/msrB
MKYFHSLSKEEDRIINRKGTEYPGTGEYDQCFEEGIYLCRRCDYPLYISSDKFHSGCGWPSFDDEIEGAVSKSLDKDQERIEILCSRCQGHLGHVFKGERLTAKNTRHCVNSHSLRFIEAITEEGYEKAYFGGGCFWGVEYFLKKAHGVVSTKVGFMGGKTVEPTYEEVCNYDTGHFEVVEVIFDPEKTNYENILKLFFEIHDPTQTMRQGPDIGLQYQSIVFYMTKDQKNIALRLIEILEKKGLKVATLLRPASLFYAAENYHQDYYTKTQHEPYCHYYTKRFT